LPTPYAVYQLRGFSEPQPIEPTAVDLTATATHGNFVYTSAPGHSRLVLYGGRDEKPLAPALLESSARDWPAFEVQAFTGPHRSDGELARALERDGFASHEILARRHVYRIVIDTNWEFSAGVRVGLGGKPDIIVGRLVAGSRNAIHAFDLFSHLRRVDERTFSLHMARDYQEQLIGPGWSSVQYDGIAPYRETVDREAELLLPIANAVPHRIGVQLLRLPGADTPQASIVLRANQQPLPPIVPTPQWTRYWWDIPKGILETGINSVVIQCSPGVRIAVSDVLIETAH
jgi:hypothetical protein